MILNELLELCKLIDGARRGFCVGDRQLVSVCQVVFVVFHQSGRNDRVLRLGHRFMLEEPRRGALVRLSQRADPHFLFCFNRLSCVNSPHLSC